MNFADCCISKVESISNLQTAKIFTTKYVYKLVERNINIDLSTFANNCYFFTINAFINV